MYNKFIFDDSKFLINKIINKIIYNIIINIYIIF